MPVPEDLTGDGELFMLRVRGDSMIEAGIFDGDYVVVRAAARRPTTATSSSRASPAKRRRSRPSCASATRSCCGPRTPTMDEMVFDPDDVTIYGKVVTLLRRL